MAHATLFLTLPKIQRDHLRGLAAERNAKNRDQVVTAAGIVREILAEYFGDKLDNSSESMPYIADNNQRQ